jgi:hypothetical protein
MNLDVFSYPIANEAGIPTKGIFKTERSVDWLIELQESCTSDLLSPKKPERRSPIVNKVKPTKNWLPFPTVGVNGLPEALSQT